MPREEGSGRQTARDEARDPKTAAGLIVVIVAVVAILLGGFIVSTVGWIGIISILLMIGLYLFMKSRNSPQA